jgi:hypothetical protein
VTAVLHFLSYMREGLGRSVAEKADASGMPKTAAATLDVTIQANEEPIRRTLALRGPGSVLGLAPGEVLRTDPPAGAGDHPVNRFPSVDLRTPSVPWLFTPAAPNAEKLMPWLVLVVVESRPGVSLARARSPLPVLSIDDAARELPPLAEAWAWAHVQANADPADIEALLAESPTAVTARLVCPRYLEPTKSYIACVVPGFEAGRLAGLGAEYVADSVALAWSDDTVAIELPVYHSWSFRTSAQAADFEELVRRLTPRPLGSNVGVHALDMSDTGSERLPATEVERGFKGALESPEVAVPPWKDPAKAEFQRELGGLLEEADGSARDDPVVAPTRYGTLAADIDDIPAPDMRASATAPKWLSESNLDPVHRAAAGLGAEVVRRNQETLMAAAWDQAQGIARVNSVLARTRLALEVGVRAQARLAAVEPGALLQLTANAHARMASDRAGQTMHGRVRAAALPTGVVSAAFRRQTRAGGALAKALTDSSNSGDEVTGRMTARFAGDLDSMLTYANLTIPSGVAFEPGSTGLDAVIRMDPVLETIDFDDFGAAHGAVVEAGMSKSAVGTRLLSRVRSAPRASKRRVERVRGRVVRPGGPIGTGPIDTGQTDTETLDTVEVAETMLAAYVVRAETSAVMTVNGLADRYLSVLGVAAGGDTELDLDALAVTAAAQMDPTALLSARLRHLIEPATPLGVEPVPASIWVAPELRDPLYAMLVRVDPEYLMPGIGELPDDTVGLAKINQPFVEAFLLGANDGLACEILWREYPANLTGTWLRTFWDSRGATTDEGLPVEDVLAVADWEEQGLGTHATEAMDPGRILVLVIKGDLPRRYPTTLITAVPARWVERDGRKVREEDATAEPLPPLFTGTLGNEAVFLGFQFDDLLDIETHVRGSHDPDDERPGWYFAFEQPPTEPAFGVDTAESDEDTALEYWKDLTWADAREADTDTHVKLAALTGTTLPYDKRGANQWTETWADSAAAMARITLQRPVRMLAHADQMLGPADAA